MRKRRSQMYRIYQFLQLRKLSANIIDVSFVSVEMFANRIPNQHQFDNIGSSYEVECIASLKLTTTKKRDVNS